MLIRAAGTRASPRPPRLHRARPPGLRRARIAPAGVASLVFEGVLVALAVAIAAAPADARAVDVATRRDAVPAPQA